jgi:calcium permeable stress-gated cation channel
LGFATIGFALMYLGFRYQFLFVLGLKVDMNGEGYLKALRQLLVGLYLATWCLIGLFAISIGDSRAAIGPLVLMVVFLIILIVCNVLVNAGLRPLESNIPLDLLAGNQASRVLSAESTEEGHGYDSDDTRADPNAVHNTSNGAPIVNKEQRTSPQHEWQPSTPADKRKSNFLTKRFENAIDKSRAKASSRLSHDQVEKMPTYDAETSQQAYMHPALAAPKKDMVVWLAQDKLGLSRALVRGNQEAGINSTDEFAWLNEKNKVEWDTKQPEKVPIYDEVRYW